jgi:branched-chain amino acid aminotransferase
VAYALPQGDNPDDAVISECGAMNLFFVFKRPQAAGSSSSSSRRGGSLELVTPPLDGTILPGITRDSILQLAAR